MKRHPHYYTNIGVALCSTLQSLADAYYTLRPHHVPKYGQHTISYIFFMVSTIQDTFCYQTVQIAPCYVPSFWHAQLSTIRAIRPSQNQYWVRRRRRHTCTRHGRVQAVSKALYGSCTQPFTGRVDGPCIRPCTYTARVNVHLCVRWNMQLATIRRSTTFVKSVLYTMTSKKHV